MSVEYISLVESVKTKVQSVNITEIPQNIRKELIDLFKTPQELVKEAERKDKAREASRKYVQRHIDDPGFREKRTQSVIRARRKRYMTDPKYRERNNRQSRESHQRRRLVSVMTDDHSARPLAEHSEEQ